MKVMSLIRVGVLRGGPSSEYYVSLETGKNVLTWLPMRYRGIDILIARDGTWHMNGLPAAPEKIFRSVDVIFNALHGKYGEDGTVQRIFECYNVPHTGSGHFASRLAMYKHLARECLLRAGMNMPRAFVVREGDLIEDAAQRALRTLHLPWMVKPSSAGSSIGVRKVETYRHLQKAIAYARKFSGHVLVEEYIQGREVTCGILEQFRGQKHYTLPIVEILPSTKHSFFDFDAKYDQSTREICPAPLPLSVKEHIAECARAAHRLLGCASYSRSDFLLSPKGLVYLLEINTLPGLTANSLFPKAAAAIGLSFPKLLDHLLLGALGRNKTENKTPF